MIIKTKEQIEQMTSLTIEQKKELCTYLGRAQGRNTDYAIKCDGDDAESLLIWWQQHQEKAAKRAARKQSRPERQQQSIADKCHEVISNLATVKGISIKKVIMLIDEKIDAVRDVERLKAESAAQRAAEKVKAFKAQHPELISEYEALQTEQFKSESRCNELHALKLCTKSKRGRTKKAIQSGVLF